MQFFQALLAILLGSVALLALARRIGAPYPSLLALGGAGVALLPFDIPLRLDPDLALTLFVAPVLLDAAFDASTRDLRRNWRPVMGLVLVAVGLTTVAVATIAHWLVPRLPWAAAVALGAIVSPPDAAAAVTVLRQVRMPHRIYGILEGESLLNDATALLVYRLAVGAAMAGGTISAAAIAPAFLLSVVAGLVVGPVVALIWVRLTHGIVDAPSSIIVQFVGCFGIWILAEHLSLSPILTIVAFAMTTARHAPERTPATVRVPSYAVWETAVLVLNAVAFVMVGIELGRIVGDARTGELARWSAFAAVVLATVVGIRFAWVMAVNTFLHFQMKRGAIVARPGAPLPTWGGGLVISWCGMRGVVTVAAALALPFHFPERELILFTAFSVTLATLVVQGLTLRPLIQALDLDDDRPVDREVRLARVALSDAALEAIEGDDSREAEILRDEIIFERRIAEEAEDGEGRPVLPIKVMHGRTLERRRERLLGLRRDGTIGDDAFHRLEEELDFADLATAQRT